MTAPAQDGAVPANADARFLLARAHERGDGVEKDPLHALELHCAAARDGHAEAAFSVGWMYLTGIGVQSDRGLAAAWFRKAASAGHEGARRMADRMGGEKRRKPVCTGAELALAEHSPPADLVGLIESTAWLNGLDPDLVMAVVATESGFRPDAVSHRNARGLMQLMEDTAARFGVTDPMDVRQNIVGGVRYLRFLLTTFDGDVRLALAAYNAGEGAVLRHGGVPPFPETRQFVRKVRRYYPAPHHPVGPVPTPARKPPPPGTVLVATGGSSAMPVMPPTRSDPVTADAVAAE